MENSQKAIVIGVTLFIVILLISIVLLSVNLGIGTAESVSEQYSIKDKNLEKQLILQYDEQIVTGQDVLDAIDFYNEKLNYNIVVYNNEVLDTGYLKGWKIYSGVKSLKGITAAYTGAYVLSNFTTYKMIYPTTEINLSTNAELKAKVDLSADYKGNIVKVDNQFLAGIVFSKQN